MKQTLLVILILLLTLSAVSLCLAGAAEQRAQEEHVWLMETLLPNGRDFEKLPYAPTEGDLLRSVHRSAEGFVIEAVTYGYADEIVMYIGVTQDGRVTGLVVAEAHETLGLGSRILTDHVFLSQFLNQSGSFVIGTQEADAFSGATEEAATAGEEISVDGISGATVSSKAVARCVSAAVAYVTGADIDSTATEWGR